MDKVRVTFAEALGGNWPDLYVPVQHNTQWLGLLFDLQAHTNDLAAVGVRRHVPATERTGQDGPTIVIAAPGDGGAARDGPPPCPASGPRSNFVQGPPRDDGALQA